VITDEVSDSENELDVGDERELATQPEEELTESSQLLKQQTKKTASSKQKVLRVVEPDGKENSAHYENQLPPKKTKKPKKAAAPKKIHSASVSDADSNVDMPRSEVEQDQEIEAIERKTYIRGAMRNPQLFNVKGKTRAQNKQLEAAELLHYIIDIFKSFDNTGLSVNDVKDELKCKGTGFLIYNILY
jgi:hypothetical protein